MDNFFLGFDCSTQNLTAILVDDSKILCRKSINFDSELPKYNTKNGIIIIENEKIVHSWPLMWVDALDLILEAIKKESINFYNIKAISGSAQQHGTVYLNDNFENIIQNLDPNDAISNQLKNCFTRKTAPIWMDSSTTEQCKEINTALGGTTETIRITGSNTFERFSGPQIRKFYQEEPQSYDSTSIIHLISSFMTSILIGKNAPIDHCDGAGMNLMNIKTKKWDQKALDATAPKLISKLPRLANPYDIIGNISNYFVKKYNFSPTCQIIPWSGDNPNSLIGTGLINKGKVCISLGTSDTYFGYMKSLKLDYNGEGHVFAAPTGDYMSLICYKNGSLAREKIKDDFNMNWEQFSEVLTKTPPGNNGKIMLPFFFPEIVPFVLEPKVYRFGFNEEDVEDNIRAIIEAQFLSMKLHSQWIKEKPKEIYATGGASANKEVLQVIANIFNTPVKQFEITDSAALGAALRTVKSYYESIGIKCRWKDIVNNYLKLQKYVTIEPEKNYKKIYEDMLKIYKKYENYVVRNRDNPEFFRKKFIKKYF